MKNGFIKVGAATAQISVADITKNTESIKSPLPINMGLIYLCFPIIVLQVALVAT